MADNLGFIWLKINPNFELGGNKPARRGFIALTPELVDLINKLEPNSEGDIMLDVAVWAKDKDVTAGKISLQKDAKLKPLEKKPLPKSPTREDEDEYQPIRKRRPSVDDDESYIPF